MYFPPNALHFNKNIKVIHRPSTPLDWLVSTSPSTRTEIQCNIELEHVPVGTRRRDEEREPGAGRVHAGQNQTHTIAIQRPPHFAGYKMDVIP